MLSTKALPKKTVKLQVKPHLLLKPDVTLSEVYKPRRPIQLFDRVIIVKTTYMVPLGFKGTVVGIQPITDPNPVRLECVKAVENFYEILFDDDIPNGNDMHGIAYNRVYKVPESSVLLIQIKDSECFPTAKEESVDVSQISKKNNSEVQDFLSNSTPVLLNEKQQSIDQVSNNKIKPKASSSGFWVPAANTKYKHESHSTVANCNQYQTSVTKKPSTALRLAIPDSSIETETLKSFLGLGIQSSEPVEEQERLKSMFPQVVPIMNATMESKRREGQIETQYFHQKSTFIPLQAQRVTQRTSIRQASEQGTPNDQLPKLELKSSLSAKTIFESHTISKSIKTPLKARHDGVRKPKIAAKFDFAG